MLTGPGKHDEEAVARRERDDDWGASRQVLGYLKKEMERAQRQGAAPDNVVEQMPSIIAALLDQIVRNVQPRDNAGKIEPITLDPQAVDRLARALKTLNDVQQSWVKIGIEAAKAAGIIIVKGGSDEDAPRLIAYPVAPPAEDGQDGDGSTGEE